MSTGLGLCNSVLRLVCSDLPGSFSEAVPPIGCGVLLQLSLFPAWDPAQGYLAWG